VNIKVFYGYQWFATKFCAAMPPVPYEMSDIRMKLNEM